MKKIILALFLTYALTSCQSSTKPVEKEADPLLEIKAQQRADSMITAARQKASSEQKQKAEWESPVKVTRSRLSTNEYGSTSVVITVKNISDKTVDAIKVKWNLTNNFGEPVSEGSNAGIGQETLRPGKSTTYRYNIYSTSATKVTGYVYNVHFKDGSTWSTN